MASLAFTCVLAAWAVFSVLRFVNMYDPRSPFQRWRRHDRLRMVPVGAFFAPEPPALEYWLLVRDLLPNGEHGAWAEAPRIGSRRLWHVLWNPDKHGAKLRTALARRLIHAAARLGACSTQASPPSLALCPEYASVLRLVSELPRLTAPRATQFAVLETRVATRELSRCVLSQLHEIRAEARA